VIPGNEITTTRTRNIGITVISSEEL